MISDPHIKEYIGIYTNKTTPFGVESIHTIDTFHFILRDLSKTLTNLCLRERGRHSPSIPLVLPLECLIKDPFVCLIQKSDFGSVNP